MISMYYMYNGTFDGELDLLCFSYTVLRKKIWSIGVK